MFLKGITILLVLVVDELFANSAQTNRHDNVRCFPPGFMFGASTASYQIEGAWNEDGKTENIWDQLSHEKPCVINNCSTGDIADDSYHRYKRDVQMMRELGLDHYRFSLSWCRILPSSFPNYLNKAGISYYNNLIDEMLKYHIKPMVTLYHWDLPQKLQKMGGWTNPEIIEWFGDYARVVFTLFGDRVKLWITINEPNEICYSGYGTADFAPRLNIPGIAEYICAKNVLLAHAKAYHIYNDEFRAKQGGFIFITISAQFMAPATENDNDVVAAEENNQFELGQYAHPIFSATGDFPRVMKRKIAAKSAAQGFPRSRLPKLTPEQIAYIKGSSDFFGLNHYSTYLVTRNESAVGRYPVPSLDDDLGTIRYQPKEWEAGAASFLKVVPWGFYKLLTKIRQDYKNPAVIITENGYSSYRGLDDERRVSYHRQYLNALLDAVHEGSNIKAYTAWSMMDVFEWTTGYRLHWPWSQAACVQPGGNVKQIKSFGFGLYEVDYESPERTRTPRKSAFVYKEIIRSRALNMSYEPRTTTMQIDSGH